MILIILSSFLFAQDHCVDSKNWIHKDYTTLNESINKKIKQSSHLVPVAREADMVLSSLIKAKSPILMNWLEKRNLISQKEELIAQEWRKYYLENFILSKYPTPDHKINQSVEHLFQEINTLGFDQKYKDHLEKIFSEAKKSSIEKISSWKIDQVTKDEITQRVSNIKLYWFSKLKGSKYQSIPLEFIKWGLAYDPTTNEINVGIQAKKYAHDSTLFSVLSHEIGHSFDPCRWSAFLKKPNPFTKLYTCLRSDTSTGAKKRDDSKMSLMLQKNYLSAEMAQSLKTHSFCNRSFYPPVGTQKEQLLEVFADWFAAEVVADSSYLDKNLRSDLCEEQKLNSGSSYLSHSDRLKKIYFAQPKIQAALKQKPLAEYCPL